MYNKNADYKNKEIRMLEIFSGYKLEGLSIASIGMCQSLESIDALVAYFLSKSEYPSISNVLDFFTYRQLEETKLCKILTSWYVNSTSIKIGFYATEKNCLIGLIFFCQLLQGYSKKTRIHTTSTDVVDFLLEYWPSDQISVIKESRVLNKDIAKRTRRRGLDILR